MAPYACDIAPQDPAITVTAPRLFKAAEGIASNLGIGQTSRAGSRLLIHCSNVDDLELLGQLLAD